MPKDSSPNGQGRAERSLSPPELRLASTTEEGPSFGSSQNTILIDDAREGDSFAASIAVDTPLEVLIAEISAESGETESDVTLALLHQGSLTKINPDEGVGSGALELPNQDVEIDNGRWEVGDVIFGTDSGDNIGLGDGNDVYIGGAGADHLRGQKGADLLFGGEGSDVLGGGAGDDALFGQGGDDILRGGNGNDRLNGGSGNDMLRGGNGDDRFVFEDGFGSDVVADFRVGDQIDLRGVSGITDFADLTGFHLTQDGNAAVISDGANTIRLANVALDDLTEDSFLF